jgi:hypothetical protein
MPQGQWVAFDVSTEESHVCGVKNDPDISVKLKGKKRKKLEEDESIDLGYEEDVLENKKDIEESKTYSNSSGVNYCIDKAIKDKKRILIDYYSDFNKESTYREISPIKKFKLKSRNYLQAYCHLRKAERNFLTRSVKTATEMEKKRSATRLAKPDISFIVKNDKELDDIKVTPKRQIVKKETPKRQIVKKETPKRQIVKKETPKRQIVKKAYLKKDEIKSKVADEELNRFNKWILIAFAMITMAITKAFILPLLGVN